MAHASTLEKAKLQMKSLRKARASRRAKTAMITPEEKERLQQQRFSKSLQEEVDVALYDFDHHQYPVVKYKLLRGILTTRLKELNKELRSKLDVTNEYTEIEKEKVLENRNRVIREKISKIEDVLNKTKGE